MSNRTSSGSPRRGERAFTLAEVVLVVVFVAGLLLVATTSVRNIRRETRTSNCQTELRTLKLATERYHAENDAYPADTSVLLDGKFVTADEVANWTVTFSSAQRTPAYRATGDCA